MYTANTIASAAEALGMTLPGSSSFPAEYPEKQAECKSIGPVMRNLLEKNILPRDIMTRSAFENAMVRTNSPNLIPKILCYSLISFLIGSNHDSWWFNECRAALDCYREIRGH